MADRTIVLATNGRHSVRGLTAVNGQEFKAYQETDDNLTYIVDMSSYLDGDTISTVTRTANGPVVSNTSNTTTRLTQRLKGFGYVDFQIVTTGGDTEEFRITIEPRANNAFFLTNTASVPQNTAQFFETVAQAAETNPGSSVNYIWVSGYTSAADGRGGLYKRVTTATNADTFTTANGVIFERSYASTTLTAAPSSEGTHSSIDNSFTGDLKGIRYPVYHKITGTATAGQPATGYDSVPEVMPFYIWLHNASGWNQATASNDGRTGIAALRVRLENNGQGDLYALWVTGNVSNQRAGYSSVLANPAAAMVGGNLTASVDGAYLNPFEVVLTDNGHDVAAAGFVVRLDRTNSTGANKAFWYGYRVQNETDTTEYDVAFSATGKAKFGLDLSFMTLDANKAAITLKADQRIYGNVTATDASGLSRYPSAVSTTYQSYSSALSAWVFVVGNNATLQIYSDQVGSNKPFNTSDQFQVSSTKVVGARNTGWTAMTGVANKATAYDTSTITLQQLAERVSNIQIALTTHGLIGA